jgi:hypothetical protein
MVVDFALAFIAACTLALLVSGTIYTVNDFIRIRR